MVCCSSKSAFLNKSGKGSYRSLADCIKCSYVKLIQMLQLLLLPFLLHTVLFRVSSVLSKLLMKLGVKRLIEYRILHASYMIWIFWSRVCLLRKGLIGKKAQLWLVVWRGCCVGMVCLAFFVCLFVLSFFLIPKFTVGINRKVLAIYFYFPYPILLSYSLMCYSHL